MSTEQALATDTETAVATSRSKRLSAADIRTVLELHDGGYKQTEIAQVVNCSQATVSNTLKQFAGTAESVARQLRGQTDETIADWRKARKVAAERGDHRPARELLEAAYPDLRPQTHAGAQGGLTIIVAIPGNTEQPRPVITVSQTPPTTMPSTHPALETGRGSQLSSVSPSASTLSPSVSDGLHRLSTRDSKG